MSAKIVRIPSQPDPDELRGAFHEALAALLAAYQPLVALGDAELIAQLGCECLLEYRDRLATDDLSLANLVRAVAVDLTASAADLELDAAAPDDPDPGEAAEIAA